MLIASGSFSASLALQMLFTSIWFLQRILVAIASLDARQSIAAEIRRVQVTMIQQQWLDGSLSKRKP